MEARTHNQSSATAEEPHQRLILAGHLILMQGVWLLCVLTGAHGQVLPAVVALLITLGVHHLLVHERHAFWLTCTGACMVGFGLDSLLVHLEIIHFPGHPQSTASVPFMVCLWANLATGFFFSLRWTLNHHALALLLAAIGGPLAYYGGVRLGALSFTGSTGQTLVILSMYWMASMVLLMLLVAGARHYVQTAVNGEASSCCRPS